MIGFIPVERNGVQHTSGACGTSGELPVCWTWQLLSVGLQTNEE